MLEMLGSSVFLKEESRIQVNKPLLCSQLCQPTGRWVPAVKATFHSIPMTLHFHRVGGKRWGGGKPGNVLHSILHPEHEMKLLKDFKQVFERLVQSHTPGQLSKEKLDLPYYSDRLTSGLEAAFSNLIPFSVPRHFYPESISD